jgi:hypothetical protein
VATPDQGDRPRDAILPGPGEHHRAELDIAHHAGVHAFGLQVFALAERQFADLGVQPFLERARQLPDQAGHPCGTDQAALRVIGRSGR